MKLSNSIILLLMLCLNWVYSNDKFKVLYRINNITEISLNRSISSKSIDLGSCMPKIGELNLKLNKKFIPINLIIDFERLVIMTNNNTLLMLMEVRQIITWKRVLSNKNRTNCFQILFSKKINDTNLNNSGLSIIKLCSKNSNIIKEWQIKFNQIKNCRHNYTFNTTVLADFDQIGINEDTNGLAHLFYRKCINNKCLKSKNEEILLNSMKRVKDLMDSTLLKKKKIECKYESKLNQMKKENQIKEKKRDFIKKIIENNLKQKQIQTIKLNKLEQKQKKLEVLKNVKKKIENIKKKEIKETKKSFKKKICQEKKKVKQIAQNLIKLTKVEKRDSYSICNSKEILQIGMRNYSISTCKILFPNQRENFKKCIKSKQFCNVCCSERAPFFKERTNCLSKCQKIKRERKEMKKREKKFKGKLKEVKVKIKDIKKTEINKYLSESVKSIEIKKKKKS